MQLFTSIKSANKAGDERITLERTKGKDCQTLANFKRQWCPDTREIEEGYAVAYWINSTFMGYL